MAKALKSFVRKKLGNTLYFLFYFCGLVYTALIISSNVRTYFKFTSNLIQTEITNNDEVQNENNLSQTKLFKVKLCPYSESHDMQRFDAFETKSRS